jgi:hypothetical protein
MSTAILNWAGKDGTAWAQVAVVKGDYGYPQTVSETTLTASKHGHGDGAWDIMSPASHEPCTKDYYKSKDLISVTSWKA